MTLTTPEQIAKATEQSDSPRPSRLPGLDLDEGLSRLMDDVQIYCRVLQIFHDNFEDFWPRLQRMRALGERETILAELHRLKGAAGHIGAHPLFGTVVELENRLRQAFDRAEPSQWEDLEQQLQEVLASIRRIIEKGLPG